MIGRGVVVIQLRQHELTPPPALAPRAQPARVDGRRRSLGARGGWPRNKELRRRSLRGRQLLEVNPNPRSRWKLLMSRVSQSCVGRRFNIPRTLFMRKTHRTTGIDAL